MSPAQPGSEGGASDDSHIRDAAHFFEVMGSDPNECDTISGRQSMASALFLRGKFSESLKYFESIDNYFLTDDIFNYNYGVALAAAGKYQRGEKILERVQGDKIRRED
ncbi:MAG: putative tetratricopeptide repeat protein 26, partial [Streblomastix strix]